MTMMALQACARGGAEQLGYERVPVPGPGEALIAVHVAGVTVAELTWELSWTPATAATGRLSCRPLPRRQAPG